MTRRAVIGLLPLGLLVALVPVSTASAATEITADSGTPVVAQYSAPWTLELRAANVGNEYNPPLDESSGTIDIFLEELPGTYIDGLVVQPDGRIFISHPPSQSWLPPGTYTVRAQFTPVPGSGATAAQVVVPEAITITPITLGTSLEVQAGAAGPTVTVAVTEPTDDERPPLGAPPGVWLITVIDTERGVAVVTREIAQTTAFDPITVSLGDELRPGVEHQVTAEYTPVDEFAPGVTVTQAANVTFRTPSGSLGEFLTEPVDLPVLALILIALGVLLGLTALVLTLLRRRRRAAEGTAEDDESTGRPDHGLGADSDADETTDGTAPPGADEKTP